MLALHERLHRATAELHRQRRDTPLFEAMRRGALPRAAYASWLRIMVTVVSVLEHHLEAGPWRPEMRALERLRADAAVFDDVETVGIRALDPMLELVTAIRRWAEHDEVALLGARYALETHALHGGWSHAAVTAQYQLEEAGAGYLAAFGEPSPRRRATLERELDGLASTERAAESVVQAAMDVLTKLGEIAEHLHPARDDEHTVVNLLNYDAGVHSVTTDPREVLAAIDAGLRTWSEYPYYEARYARRGRRFTRSDSAWLVTLAHCDRESALSRVEWLVRLLAMRGMPSLLFEEHLFHLHDALVEAVPERASRYQSLAEFGQHLRGKRLGALPSFDALSSTFPYERPLANVGPILVGAVADERLGLEGCVPSVQSWLADPERYPASWISAVDRSIAEARDS